MGVLGGNRERATEEKKGYLWEETIKDIADRFPSD